MRKDFNSREVRDGASPPLCGAPLPVLLHSGITRTMNELVTSRGASDADDWKVEIGKGGDHQADVRESEVKVSLQPNQLN